MIERETMASPTRYPYSNGIPTEPCDYCGGVVVRTPTSRRCKECYAESQTRAMMGFFDQLTPEQQKAALEYEGEDC